MSIDFTIAFICHNEPELLEKTISQNIQSLCHNTNENYDIILVVDGAETVDYEYLVKLAYRYGVNEVRLRTRIKNCAKGDPSNNGHFHLFSTKTPYLITLESDVVLFNLELEFDVLKNIKELFKRHEKLCLATRMDDHDCWQWKLQYCSQLFEEGILSVNRVSSHFLVYDTNKCQAYFNNNDFFNLDLFYDHYNSWYNYEDMISKYFSYPKGPGIGYLENFPIRTYHCDEKIKKDSPFYSKALNKKIQIFEKRKKEVELLISTR